MTETEQRCAAEFFAGNMKRQGIQKSYDAAFPA